MSLSRPPSPNDDGGWSSPGLTTQFAESSGRSSPATGLRAANGNGNGNGTPVTWDGARKKSSAVNGGYPSFATKNNGFFSRHMRSISSSLPKFVVTPDEYSYAEKEKLGRGRWLPNRNSKLGRVINFALQTFQRFRTRSLIAFAFIFAIILFYSTRESLQESHAYSYVENADRHSFALLVS